MRRVLPSLLASFSLASSAAAQTQVDRFYPPVVGRDSETVVKAEGKFDPWPVEVVSSRADLTIAPSEESGQFKVVVPADAAPGVAWIRVQSPKAASALTPLLIDTVAPQAEEDANDSIAQTKPIALPATLYGRLEKRNDVDMFRVSLKADEQLIVTCTANQILGSPMDAVLQLSDAEGNVLAQSDDSRGLDPQLVYRAESEGDVIVRLFAFPETPNSTIGYSGAASYVYTLQMTTGPYVEYALPLLNVDSEVAAHRLHGLQVEAELSEARPNVFGRYARQAAPDSWLPESVVGKRVSTVALDTTGGTDEPVAVDKLPALLAGHIGQPDETDVFRFPVSEGKSYQATVHARSLGFVTDSVIEIVDAKSGEQVARDDDASRSDYDTTLTFTAKTDGEYELRISDIVDGFGLTHAYTIELQQAEPVFSLNVAADHFEIPTDKPLEIPVTVTRQHKFDKPVEIGIEGLNDAVSVEAVTSEPKGNSSKAVTLKLTQVEGKPFRGPIQIIGTIAEEEGEGSPVVATHALRPTIAIDTFWLTAEAKSK